MSQDQRATALRDAEILSTFESLCPHDGWEDDDQLAAAIAETCKVCDCTRERFNKVLDF